MSLVSRALRVAVVDRLPLITLIACLLSLVVVWVKLYIARRGYHRSNQHNNNNNSPHRSRSGKERTTPSSGSKSRETKRKEPSAEHLAGSRAPRKIQAFIQHALESATVAKALPVGLTPAQQEEQIIRVYPRRFEVHGHVVVVKLNDGVQLEDFRVYACSFAKSFWPVNVDVVVCDTGGIAGELRFPEHIILWNATPVDSITFPKHALRRLQRRLAQTAAGTSPQPAVAAAAAAPSSPTEDSPMEEVEREADDGAAGTDTKDVVTAFEEATNSITFTTHIENGVYYSFDVLKVMFSSGNTTERMHFAALDATNERVVDMFAGIGYFTIPLAMHGKPKRIYALEKNPVSVTFLRFNAYQNGVGDTVATFCGDNREVTGERLCGRCNRVLMGYLPDCSEFLPRAISFLRRGKGGCPKGVVHYHFLAGKQQAHSTVMQHVLSQLGDEAVSMFEVTELRLVKSYAPNRYHYVADLRFGKRMV